MELSEKHISRLINGEVKLTPDVACRLEMVLGLPAQFWNNLEAIYREKTAKAEAENAMEDDIDLAKKLPYKEMAQNGWVPMTSNSKEKVINLRKYFEVVHLGLLNNSSITRIACRRLSVTQKGDFALIAWAQKAKLEARKIDTEPINLKILTEKIPEIRKMTRMRAEEFCPKLIDELCHCGIALVFLPHIGGSFRHGATFIDGNKIVIGLTVRGKDADKFWFSLFHEIAHILYGHVNQAEGTSAFDEQTANEFARDTLISGSSFREFVRQKNFSKQAIKQFARSIGIDEGIVVGRLQKEGHIPYNWHNCLKTKYEIAS
ncbi:MAG: XRE family transcriptional regulator [Ruthenibacterium sp.]